MKKYGLANKGKLVCQFDELGKSNQNRLMS